MKLSAEEKALFRDTVHQLDLGHEPSGVGSTQGYHLRPNLAGQRTSPDPEQQEYAHAHVTHAEHYAHQGGTWSDPNQYRVFFYRKGVQKKLLKRWPEQYDACLDVHGLSLYQATQRLNDFLHDAHANGQYSLSLIHGHGQYRQSQGSVLREHLRAQMAGLPFVLAMRGSAGQFRYAGATDILLKRKGSHVGD